MDGVQAVSSIEFSVCWRDGKLVDLEIEGL